MAERSRADDADGAADEAMPREWLDDSLWDVDVSSTVERRQLLATLAATGGLATAGCLGFLGSWSKTGPRPADPTPRCGDTDCDGDSVGGGDGSDGGESTDTGGGQETGTEAASGNPYDVTWVNEGGTTIDVAADEILLDRALDEGLEPPYQCRRGLCGNCTSRVPGDGHEYVEHDGNEYLSEEQISGGYVLTCVGSPKQDFEIETGKQEEAEAYTPTQSGDGETTETDTRTTTANVETFDVNWVNEGDTTIDVAANEALLSAALDEDLDPPYQCAHGVCGHCTSKVPGPGSEYVEHDGNQYLDEDQIAEGYVLTCVGYPLQDFEITTGMKEEADQV